MRKLWEANGRPAQSDTSRRRFLGTAAGVGVASVAGLSSIGTASASGEERWRFETGDVVWSSPTVVDGTVFIGSRDAKLYSLDAGSGEERWRFATEDEVWQSPTVVDGTVFVGSEDRKVYALDAGSGEERWRFETGEGETSSPTVVDGTVFAASLNATNVYALDASSGEERWQFETGERVRSGLTVVDGTVFLGTDANLYALEAGSGEERWRFDTGDRVSSSPTVVDGTVFVGSGDAIVFALDAVSGEDRWQFTTGAEVWSSPTVADGTVFVGSADANVYALDAGSGDERWRFETGDEIWSSPTVADGAVFIGSTDANVYALDAGSGEERWRFATESGVQWSSPTVVDGTVFIGSTDANVYALDAGVDGSSRGSRVMHGTFGHHSEWHHAGQNLESIFELSIDSTNAPVDAGENLDVAFTVHNTGVVEGTRTIEIEIEPRDSDSVTVTLDAGESTTESFSIPTTAADTGEYPLTVSSNDDTATESVAVLEPASFEVSIESTDAPVAAGEDLDVAVAIHNTGAVEGTQTVEIEGDGFDTDTVTVTLDGGETTTEALTLPTTTDDAGEYTLTVSSDDDTATDSVTVSGPAPDDDDDTTPAGAADGDGFGTQELAVLGGGGGVLTLLGVYVLMQRTGDDDEPARPGTGDTTEDTTKTATPPPPDDAATADSPPPADVIDEHLDAVRTRLDSARQAADEHAYSRALGACEQAIDVAEDARETALKGALGRVADVDEHLDDARQLRTDLETERNAHQHATIELDRIADELGDAADSFDAEPPDETLARLDDLAETLAETADRVDEHGFDDLRERVETLENRHTRLYERCQTRTEAHGQATRALARVEDALAAAEEALDDGTPQTAVNALDGIPETLDDAGDIIDEHDFSALGNQLDAHARRHERIREDATDALATVPSSIPSAPRLSLSYDDIQKGKSLGRGGNADVFYATTTTDDDVELALKEPRTAGISHADTVEQMLTKTRTWEEDDTDYLVAVLDTRRDVAEPAIEAAETWRRFDDQNTLVAVVATHHTDTVEQLQQSGETIQVHDDEDTVNSVVDTVQTRSVEPLMNEAETWQKLDNHDHIVSVIDYGSEPLPWIAMEYMDGGHLGHRAGEMDLDQALWTALATTEGVRHAHNRGVAHFDLKPQNVLLRHVEGAWDIPKVADWGLSRHLLDHSSSVAGMSPAYAAPEQFDTDAFGWTDNVTDIYQLGAVFYEMFTGWPPFDGTMLEVVQQVQTEEPMQPSDRADLPSELDDILLTALATDKDDRYEHVLYLRDELQALWEEYSPSH